MNKQPYCNLFHIILLCMVCACSAGCSRPEFSGSDTGLWSGMEEITVVLGGHKAVICLRNMPVSMLDGIRGIRLSDVVAEALPDARPEGCFFNFITSDGFDMSNMALKNHKGLPGWEDMCRGFLYDSGSSSGLSLIWQAGTNPGDYGRFYNCKRMDGGTIQIFEKDIL